MKENDIWFYLNKDKYKYMCALRIRVGASPTTTTTTLAPSEIGIFGGGDDGSEFNVIDYITIDTTGNATDFGDLNTGREGTGACSNGTDDRGIFAGGHEYGGGA